jgi:uncharacterized membrane protein
MNLATNAPLMTDADAPARPRAEAALPLALVALSLIPLVSGVYRLSLLARGHTPTPDDVRIAAHPVAMALHVVGATLFCVLGALQFWPRVLRARPWLHRALGWWLAPLGALGALSGVWMALHNAPPPDSSAAVVVMRVAAGGAMALCLALGVRAAVRRELGAHRAWMVRAYALGSAAGTQSLVFVPLTLLLGQHARGSFALGLAAGWALNVAVAEAALRRGWLRGASRSSRRP